MSEWDSDEAGSPSRRVAGYSPLAHSRHGTETIDLDSLFSKDVTVSGSFDLRRIETTSLGQLLDAIPIPSLLVNQDSLISFANAGASTIQPGENLSGQTFYSLFGAPEASRKLQAEVRSVLDTRKTKVFETVIGAKKKMWGRVHLRSIRFGRDRYVLVLVEDLTSQKRQVQMVRKLASELKKTRDDLERRVKERTAELLKSNIRLKQEIWDRKIAESDLNLASNVIKSSNEAILITDLDANIVDVNDAFCEITGYARDELLGQNPRVTSSGKHGKEFWTEVWDSIDRDGQWKGEVWDRRKNGEIFPKLLSISKVGNERGEATNYVGIFSDISKMKESQERLEYLAHHDPLTALANRVMFRERLGQAVAKADRTDDCAAVMFLDLDDFKTINDTLGHPFGDQLLVAVARRLSGCVRSKDTVARLGGDEFALVLSEFASLLSLDFLAKKIISRLSEPFEIDKRRIFITCTIGIAVYPNDGLDIDRLVQSADVAMYHAKVRGKSSFAYFSSDLDQRMKDRLELEIALREALERNEFELFYQAQVHLESGRVSGCEALIRWNHPQQGLVSPVRFIELAEETGLIRPLGEWVIREACQHAKAWQAEGLPEIRVAVNVSGRQISGQEIIRTVYEILKETDLHPRLLDLEITESALMQDKDSAVEILRDLKRIGVGMSIDDFGTGYSSLNHLKRFPVDKLKIDRSFVEDIPGNADDQAIVKAIIAVGHSMKLKVLAEGVETDEQLEFLKENGCDEVQGYYYSKPIPEREFSRLVLDGLR
ncbi:EAL domain-containing protein [Thermodesulfobacteriota bacterium]